MVDTDLDGLPELYVAAGRGRAAVIQAYQLTPFARI
jgi:hypothetical protein